MKCERRDAIYRQYNLYYPATGIKEQKMHRYLFPIQDYEENWNKLSQELAHVPHADVLISEEINSTHFAVDDKGNSIGPHKGFLAKIH